MLLRQGIHSINAQRCHLFGAFALCLVFIVIQVFYINNGGFRESVADKKPISHLAYDKLLKPIKELLGSVSERHLKADFTSMAGHYSNFDELKKRQMQAVVTSVTTTRPKQDSRLLPLKKMFENAGEEHRLKEKSVYSNITSVPLADLREEDNKPHVLLLVIVPTASYRHDRRYTIRRTWWQKCFGKVRCFFFTDGLQLEDQQQKDLVTEHNTFGDIKFSPTEDATMILGERFLYLIMWAKAKFNFQYFLRLDDDFFICMDRLVNELPFRPSKGLSWGWFHCQREDLIYMDEAWALFSEDVIEQFLAQDLHSLFCHPFGDQTFSLWVNLTGINLTRFDDHRIHHWPPAGKIKEFFTMTAVCDNHIGVHGSYPKLMSRLWFNSNDGAKTITPVILLENSCPLKQVFDVNAFSGIYKFTPKLCLDRPRWVTNLTSWKGFQ